MFSARVRYSQCGNGVVWSLSIIILSPQWSLMKWFNRTLLLRDVPRKHGNGHWHNCILVGKMISYTSGRCSVWMTVSRSHSIVGSVPCICLRWVVMDLNINYTPQSGQGMRRCRRSWYVTPYTFLLRLKYYSEIPVRISPRWKAMVSDFATLAIRMTLLNIPMRTLMDPWSHYGSLDPIMPSSA